MKQYNMETLKTLLANTINEKPDSYTIQQIFSSVQSFHDLIDVSEEELMTIKGIGKTKAKAIVSALQLAKVMYENHDEERYVIRSPRDVYDYVYAEMKYLTQEHFVLLGLNTKNQVMFKQTVTVGTLNASLVHPREVFRPLIRRSCASAIVLHNHPSGDPTPSREDIKVTERLSEVGKIVGIELLDHVIVGNDYVSLKEKGYL
ncbi:hypothetical protein CIB95_01985 [Lottiidibacillus patelloidae]|uniref:MPN domain-containing protein n=2 Tax=Lottiidibacillus patelloidae TaxID=2670334 RepID=A0A263BXC8_9BACI|nr:hypothetical protein CIB95_01985 [Lottiidibacillus patelloidae]